MASDPQRKTLRRDLGAALVCGALVAALAGVCCAAVPLYAWFGRGGEFAAVAWPAPHHRAPRLAAVRFDPALADDLRAPPRRGRMSLAVVTYRRAGVGCSVGRPRAAADVAAKTAPADNAATRNAATRNAATRNAATGGLHAPARASRALAIVRYVDSRCVEASGHDDAPTVALLYASPGPRTTPAPPTGGI